MAYKLEITSGVGSYNTIKQLAHGSARTKGTPEIVASILMFPFDSYAIGDDQLLVYSCERTEATAPADSTLLAAVNIALGDKLYWDAGNSKITNVATGNVPIGRALEAKDFSGGVVSGDTLLFELNPDLRLLNYPVAGVAAGYKVARDETALDGSNPTPVAHGLTTCVAFVAMLKGTAAPGVGTSVLTSNINGANVDVYAWKPTSNSDPTLVASTGTESFYWVAIGT